jgi:hypothetical protein
MDDGIAAGKGRERLRPQQAMGIGNRANGFAIGGPRGLLARGCYPSRKPGTTRSAIIARSNSPKRRRRSISDLTVLVQNFQVMNKKIDLEK